MNVEILLTGKERAGMRKPIKRQHLLLNFENKAKENLGPATHSHLL